MINMIHFNRAVRTTETLLEEVPHCENNPHPIGHHHRPFNPPPHTLRRTGILPIALATLLLALLVAPSGTLAQGSGLEILTPPSSQWVHEGDNVTLTVSARANEPIVSYMWGWHSDPYGYFMPSRERVVGTDSPTLTLTNVTQSDAGYYSVAVSCLHEGITSAKASLWVLPTGWEIIMGLDSLIPGVPLDGGADADGDGVLNWQEYAAGTNPTNPASVLKLIISVTGSDPVRLSFWAGLARRFLVESSDGAGPWEALGEPILGEGRTVTLMDPRPRPENSTRWYRVALLGFSLISDLAWMPAGQFTMGSPESEAGRQQNEGPLTGVTISREFWAGKHEVTQGDYALLMGNNPSWLLGDPNRPVENVSWPDATNYCARLSARERAAGRLPQGYAYRLPTEAEWEYACRAGTTTATAFGAALTSAQANFNGNAPYGTGELGPFRGTTTRVGTFPANPWGLLDCHGNVAEWCADYYRPSLLGGPGVDPTGPAEGAERVIRGGHWRQDGTDCRSAARANASESVTSPGVGFRVVLAATTPSSLGFVEGVVRYDADHQPVPSLPMILMDLDRSARATNLAQARLAIVASTFTTANGRYQFGPFPPGHYAVGPDPEQPAPGYILPDPASGPTQFQLSNDTHMVDFLVQDEPLFEDGDQITVTILLDPKPVYKRTTVGWYNGYEEYDHTYEAVLMGEQQCANFWVPNNWTRSSRFADNHFGDSLSWSFNRNGLGWFGFGVLNNFWLHILTLSPDTSAHVPSAPYPLWTYVHSVKYYIADLPLSIPSNSKRYRTYRYTSDDELVFVEERD